MLVLGISCFYHDAAACLLHDGVLIAAAEEERFTRKKHDSSFPSAAIAYCLREANATQADLDYVVFYEKPRVKFERILSTCVAHWPWAWKLWSRALPAWLGSKLDVGGTLRRHLGSAPRLLFCDHHLSHAASAYLTSPFDDSVVLTLDGVGEWTTTSFGLGRCGGLSIDGRISYPHSLGLFYSALTAYLGFHVNDAEWKVMGLAAYGRPTYLDQFRQLIDVRSDGSFRLDLRYFSHQWSIDRMYSPAWERLFGRPGRRADAEIDEFYRDVACSGQRFLEEVVLKMVCALHERYALPRLCLAGGVALNGLVNWAVRTRSPFREVYVPPAPGDAGGAIGAALFTDAVLLGRGRRNPLAHAFWGPAFTNLQIADALAQTGLVGTLLEEEALLDRTTDLLLSGSVVGWFHGRMEVGPRSLGSRSILCDPRRGGAREQINQKVKFREWFRPFAPAVPLESAARYFDVPAGVPFPFMSFVPSVRPEYRARLAAVTHVDGTSRIQTLTATDNPRLYRLVRRFGRRSGVDVLLNTSFNVRGEPVVCTPADACRTFLASGLDALVIGDYLVETKPPGGDAAEGMRRSTDLERRTAETPAL